MYSQIVHNIIIIYQTSNVKVGLNTILTNQFQTHFLPIFMMLKVSKFCT